MNWDSIKSSFQSLANSTYLSNTVLQWIFAALLALGVFIGLLIARRVLIGRGKALARRWHNDAADLFVSIVERTSTLFLLAMAIVIGSLILQFPATVEDGRSVAHPGARVRLVIFVVALAIQAALWSRRLIDYGIKLFINRRLAADGKPDPALVATMGIARFIIMVVVLSIIALLAAQNLGIDVTAMIAGLGIGGIAIALAAQNVLGDLFASLSIVLDKPFVVGDFIVVGDLKGTVEDIGVKTTRLRAVSGEQLICPNAHLLSSQIQNFKRMHERRIMFTIGVTYQTPREKLRAIPRIIREAIERQPQVRFERAHFKAFGPSSLDFEAAYFVLSSDYDTYMNIQQEINFELVDRFAGEGIAFAYPTQTLHLERADAEHVAAL
jgi:small-conductance mechanosensitive channel